MVHSLDFVLYANRNPLEKAKLTEALSKEVSSVLVVDRHILLFDPKSSYVTVDRVSEDIPFANKNLKCRIPYCVLQKLLDDDWSDLTGLELL